MFNFYLESKAPEILKEKDSPYLKEWVKLLVQDLQVNAGNYILYKDLTIKNLTLLIHALERIKKIKKCLK